MNIVIKISVCFLKRLTIIQSTEQLHLKKLIISRASEKEVYAENDLPIVKSVF